MAALRILADANIPHVEALFGRFGRVRAVPAEALTPEAVAEADVLLVRSVTPVGEALLEGTPVRFVGTATIGTDHVDRAWLDARGIAFAAAPGSNADSVVEYVLAALLALAAERDEPLAAKTVGVVGCGRIGGALAARLEVLGARVLRCDPPLAEAAARAGRSHAFVGFERLVVEADVLTLHVPLLREGAHPTFHLVDEAVLTRLRPGSWLVNTARGAVVERAALARALARGVPAAAVLDVWEGEPEVPVELLARCALATPHIAGYGLDGKVRGAVMLAEALAAWLGRPGAIDPPALPAPPPLAPPPAALPAHRWLDALVRQAYDVRADAARLRALFGQPPAARRAGFARLRATYPPRRAFSAHVVSAAAVPPALHRAVAEGLGFRLAP